MSQPLRLHQLFPAGCYFVPLETTTAVSDFWEILAQQMGIALHDQTTAVSQLLTYLHQLPVLLLLDNAETLADGLPPLLTQLLSQTSQLKLLLTSRVPFRVPGEWVYPLYGLAYQPDQPDSPALHLFVQTARRFRRLGAALMELPLLAAPFCTDSTSVSPPIPTPSS